MKNYFLPLVATVAIGTIALGFIFYKNRPSSPNTNISEKSVVEASPARAEIFDVTKNVCDVFPLATVNKLTGKNFTSTKNFVASDGKTSNCEYFADNHFVIINFSLMDVAKQRKGYEILERKISTDTRIGMDHFMVHSGKSPEEIIDIYLIFGPSKYVRVGKSSVTVIDNDGLIGFAKQIGEILSGKVSYTVSQETYVTPTNLSPTKTSVPLPSAQSIGRNFLTLLGEKKIESAINMMSPNLLGNDSQKQAWAVQFNSFEKFEVVSTEDTMKDTWTPDTQEFKAVIDVQMKPEAANAPIPNYGWENGKNFRWIIMKKIGDKWMIDAISTGP